MNAQFVAKLLGSLPLFSPSAGFANRVMHAVIGAEQHDERGGRLRFGAVLRSNRRALTLAASVALLFVGALTSSVIWAVAHQETLAALGPQLSEGARHLTQQVLTAGARELTRQPWYGAATVSSFRASVLMSVLALLYVSGMVVLRRLLATPSTGATHANA
jgi:hypothetical protein